MKTKKSTTLGQPHQIRFHPEIEETLYALAQETDASFSQSVRELVAIALAITSLAETVTLKDLLWSFKDVFAETPYYRSMIEVERKEDETRQNDRR